MRLVENCDIPKDCPQNLGTQLEPDAAARQPPSAEELESGYEDLSVVADAINRPLPIPASNRRGTITVPTQ